MIEPQDSQRIWNEMSPFQYRLFHFQQVGNIVLTINERERTGVKREWKILRWDRILDLEGFRSCLICGCLWSGENGEERTGVSEVKTEAVKWRNEGEGLGSEPLRASAFKTNFLAHVPIGVKHLRGHIEHASWFWISDMYKVALAPGKNSGVGMSFRRPSQAKRVSKHNAKTLCDNAPWI